MTTGQSQAHSTETMSETQDETRRCNICSFTRVLALHPSHTPDQATGNFSLSLSLLLSLFLCLSSSLLLHFLIMNQLTRSYLCYQLICHLGNANYPATQGKVNYSKSSFVTESLSLSALIYPDSSVLPLSSRLSIHLHLCLFCLSFCLFFLATCDENQLSNRMHENKLSSPCSCWCSCCCLFVTMYQMILHFAYILCSEKMSFAPASLVDVLRFLPCGESKDARSTGCHIFSPLHTPN